jgi:hypothetical protein
MILPERCPRCGDSWADVSDYDPDVSLTFCNSMPRCETDFRSSLTHGNRIVLHVDKFHIVWYDTYCRIGVLDDVGYHTIYKGVPDAIPYTITLVQLQLYAVFE